MTGKTYWRDRAIELRLALFMAKNPLMLTEYQRDVLSGFSICHNAVRGESHGTTRFTGENTSLC